MNTHSLVILSVIAILWGSGCSSSKKFDFNTAYKFSQYDYSKQASSTNPEQEDLVASTSSQVLTIPSKLPGSSLQPDKAQIRPHLKDLCRSDLRQIRKELKQQVKSLDSEIKSLEASKRIAPQEERAKFERSIVEKKVQRDATKAMNHKIFLGILIGAAGLVLLIIGGSTLGVIGGIALVVGLVLVVWGFIEKGSF